jgi:hypothetical protein
VKRFVLFALILVGCSAEAEAGSCGYGRAPSCGYGCAPSCGYGRAPSYGYASSYSRPSGGYAPSYRKSYCPPSLSWRYYSAGVYGGTYWDTGGYYAWYGGNWYRQGYGICNGVAAVSVPAAPAGLTLDDVERIVAKRIAEASVPKPPPPPPPPPKGTGGLTLEDVERLVAKRLAERVRR